MELTTLLSYLKVILLRSNFQCFPDLLTVLLTRFARNATLHQSYKCKMTQHPEEGFYLCGLLLWSLAQNEFFSLSY